MFQVKAAFLLHFTDVAFCLPWAVAKSFFSFQKIMKIGLQVYIFPQGIWRYYCQYSFHQIICFSKEKKVRFWDQNCAFSELHKFWVLSFQSKIRRRKKKGNSASSILKSHVCNSQSWCFCFHNYIPNSLKHNVAVSFGKQQGWVTSSRWQDIWILLDWASKHNSTNGIWKKFRCRKSLLIHLTFSFHR